MEAHGQAFATCLGQAEQFAVNRPPLAVSLPDCTESPAPAATSHAYQHSEVRANHESIIGYFDVSMVTAVLTPALLYRALLCLFPEPRGIARRGLWPIRPSHL